MTSIPNTRGPSSNFLYKRRWIPSGITCFLILMMVVPVVTSARADYPPAELPPALQDSQKREWETSGPEALSSMLSYAQMLNVRMQQSPVEQQIEDLKQLSLLADDLMALDQEPAPGQPDPTQIAFQMKASSLLGLVGAEQEFARENLQGFCRSYYRDGADPDLQKAAYFLELTVALNDSRAEDADGAAMLDQVKTILGKFPGDETIATRLIAVTDQLELNDKSGLSQNVLQLLGESLGSASETEPVLELRSVISDRIHLSRIGFPAMVKSIQQEPFAQHDDLVNAVYQLAERKEMGRKIFFEIMTTVQGLEFNGRTTQAKTVFEKLGRTMAGHTDETLTTAFAADRKLAYKRFEIIGKPIQVAGVDAAGAEFDASVIADKKAVAVYFWSVQSEQSVRGMQALVRYWSLYSEKGFGVVAICVDEDPSGAKAMFERRAPPWPAIYQISDQHRELQDLVGAQGIPSMILIDGEQNVLRARVNLVTMGPVLDQILQTSTDGATDGG